MWTKESIVGIYLLITTSEALRFLVVFPVPVRSHGNLGRGVCKHLLQAGHEVSLSMKDDSYICIHLNNDSSGNYYKHTMKIRTCAFNETRSVLGFQALLEAGHGHALLAGHEVNLTMKDDSYVFIHLNKNSPGIYYKHTMKDRTCAFNDARSVLGFQSLLEAGHGVIHITSFPRDNTVNNLTEISTAHIIPNAIEERKKRNTFSVQYLIGKGNVLDTVEFFSYALKLHKLILEDEVIRNFLSKSTQHFDAVIAEWFFSNLFGGLAPLFKCPLIYIGSTEPHWQILRLVGEIPNPAYTCVNILSPRGPPITLWDKIYELLTLIKKYFVVVVKFGPLEKNTYDVIYPPIAESRGVSMPFFEDAIYNASMILMNAHPSVGLAYKLPQNVKLIGGFHIVDDINPISTNIKKLMDEAKYGIIYFSLGSSVQSSLMSDKMKRSLLKVFSKLKQIVIWKFEAELEDDLPSNVYLWKWAPQQNILAHPNLKIFISHAGHLSNLEAISHGVPMITVPMYGDQIVNAKVMAAKGSSINIALTENLANDIHHALNEMLSNSTYKKKAKEASVIFHHRLVPPGAELVYWVEHVVKTGGGHLRSPGAHVPLYQKMYIDVLAIIFVLVVSIIIVYRHLGTGFRVQKFKIG